MAHAQAAVSTHPEPVTIWPAVVHRSRSTQKKLLGHRRTGREYRNETAHPLQLFAAPCLRSFAFTLGAYTSHEAELKGKRAAEEPLDDLARAPRGMVARGLLGHEQEFLDTSQLDGMIE
jgi:hypothetical protein